MSRTYRAITPTIAGSAKQGRDEKWSAHKNRDHREMADILRKKKNDLSNRDVRDAMC